MQTTSSFDYSQLMNSSDLPMPARNPCTVAAAKHLEDFCLVSRTWFVKEGFSAIKDANRSTKGQGLVSEEN